MGRLISHLKETLKDFTKVLTSFFYDSYSGINKKSLVIVVSTCVAAIALIVVLVKVVPQGSISKTVSDGVSVAIDAVLPADVATNVKDALGIGKVNIVNYDTFYYPEPERNATNASDIGDSGIDFKTYTSDDSDEDKEDEWVWDGSWGTPTVGDIQSTEGNLSSEKGTKADTVNNGVSIDSSEQIVGRYNNWSTPNELQNLALLTTQSIQDNILLQINNTDVYGTWDAYTLSARTTLVDISVLGTQIKDNMSENVVAIWYELEDVYNKLYVDIYACESGGDLSEVAVSDTYNQAVDLTSKFIEVLNAE